ncbi:MAG: Outer-rane lipoprotein carrier protein precursor [Pseudomonadota bacterium]|jgi:outer membrane lipoprotein carrier protein
MWRRVSVVWVLALWCGAAQADGLAALDVFLREVKSAQADFTQVVSAPKREGQSVGRQKTSSGRFEFRRPNQFRFEYLRPFEQSIVADGKTLWIYDVDLNQVTSRAQQEVLGNTPAALIASGSSVAELARLFVLTSVASPDGVDWVQAQPRQRDGSLNQVRLAFSKGQLTTLEIEDGLGQRSVLTFQNWRSNTGMGSERFRFQPPAGAAVLRP